MGKLILPLASALLLSAASASAKPNFTGLWKMDASQSNFGQIPGPASMERTIKHVDPAMEISTTQAGARGEVKSQVKYTTDGKESPNTLRGEVVKSICQWEGDTLVIRYSRPVGPAQLSVTERWMLSAGGDVTTIETQFSGAMPGQWKIVLRKQ